MALSNETLIEFCGIRKAFGAVLANDAVNLSVRAGSVHAIVGENGAGKSTAMKILYGQYAPSAGEIRLRGKTARWRSPREAIAAGIGMVHQHFMLAETHTVLENILIETPRPFWKPYSRQKARERLNGLAKQYGLEVNLDSYIGELSVGLQQRVEILKLLFVNSDILILDEPTAVLTPQEVISFFKNLRKLKEEGKTILLITHKLKEVMAFADRVTVFRAGRVVGEREICDTNAHELAELMVGRKVHLGEAWEKQACPTEIALDIKHLIYLPAGSQKPKLRNINLNVRAGEIVGIAGVEGNGQSELIRAILFPREYRSSGSLSLFGENINHYWPQQIRDLGVAVLAENRLREALLLGKNLLENFLLGYQWDCRFQTKGFLHQKLIADTATKELESYDVRPRDNSVLARNLSGGNQQKLVVARELFREPRFLLAAQPTRGVDVGAIEFIHKRIFESRDRGAAVLLFSSELDEILHLADRILVIYDGQFVAEYARGAATEIELGFAMGGGKKETSL